MKIIYPYNEILPKKTAHDVYIFNECTALAKAGVDVVLFCGQGSFENPVLATHYELDIPETLHIKRIPILRKNRGLSLSWNLPFFYLCQREIERIEPHWLICSVLKQAHYHFKKRKKGRCLYEVHQLAHYPTTAPGNPHLVQYEKNILDQADLITVTTAELKTILLEPPYAIKKPIEIVPLAVKVTSLPKALSSSLTFAYVGQLYEGQGIPLLLQAWESVPKAKLKIIGGKPSEVNFLRLQISARGLNDRVTCLGYLPPGKIAKHLEDVHAFIAPFESMGKMPYVAHTKLLEYAEWGRPIITSNLPVARSHFEKSGGVVFFQPDNHQSLAEKVQSLTDPLYLGRLQNEIQLLKGHFTWSKRAELILSLL